MSIFVRIVVLLVASWLVVLVLFEKDYVRSWHRMAWILRSYGMV